MRTQRDTFSHSDLNESGTVFWLCKLDLLSDAYGYKHSQNEKRLVYKPSATNLGKFELTITVWNILGIS